ncbi:MAG TPA: hypothetical protein VJA21_12025 [Verrucomicrobiae bacterium]
MRFTIKITGVCLAILLACAVLLFVILPRFAGWAFVPRPHSSILFYGASGTVLDEQTHAPMAGAKIFVTSHPKVTCESDSRGRFKLKEVRQWHAGEIGVAAGASDWPFRQDWGWDHITISHTNYTPCEVAWLYPNDDVILLRKVGEPSGSRPWLTFNSNGAILQDMGAAQYLKPGGIQIVEHKNENPSSVAVPSKVHIGFGRRVYQPHVTPVSSFAGDDRALPGEPLKGEGWDWEFSIYWLYSGKTIDTKDSTRVYRLEFIP